MDIVTLAAARKYADTKFLGFVPKGAYNPANENKYGEWYTHEGGSYGYIYPTPSTGVPVTDTTHWQQIASKGIQGEQGIQGEVGPAGTASAATVAFAPVGSVSATNVQAAIAELDTEKAAQAHLTEKTGYGVLSGLVVSQQSVPDMTVKCSAGVIYMANGTRYAPAAVASISVAAADATNPRIDIVYVSSAGAVTYLAGTAAASPAAPSVPSGGLKLAEIRVEAEVTSILTANISGLGKRRLQGEWIIPTLYSGFTGDLKYRKTIDGRLEIYGFVTTLNTSGPICNIPVGYRPFEYVYTKGYQFAFRTNEDLASNMGMFSFIYGNTACDFAARIVVPGKRYYINLRVPAEE